MTWRTGKSIPVNVYDENGKPVCQCQNAVQAALIVRAVNELIKKQGGWV